MSSPDAAEQVKVSAPVSPGVEVLLRGDKNGNNHMEAKNGAGDRAVFIVRHWRYFKWILWGADLCLIVLCAKLLLQTVHPLGFWEAVLCILGFATGAALAIIGFLGDLI